MESFETLVRRNLQAGMERTEAVNAAARANPDAHKEYLLRTNRRRVAHLIEDRFDLEQEARESKGRFGRRR